MKLIKAMATVAGLTGLSRIAGFTRDILTAAILGAGPIADAFFVALKLPNFFRRVTAEGAFSVAFVPLYTEAIEKDGKERADDFASNALMIMIGILSAVTLLALTFMPAIISVIAPGFADEPQRFESAVEFSRITFPYLLLMSCTALLGGVLNALNRFAPFAFAPVLFNLCLIAALLLSDAFKNAGHALSFGIAFAGILQLAWLYIATLRANVRIRFRKPSLDPKIKKTFALMGPGVIGAGVMHINLFADMIIASFLGSGAISHLYYADRLNQLPLGIVGIAVGTALLPMLSKAITNKDDAESQDLFNRALEMCLLLALPAAFALLACAPVFIEGLFQRGAFEASDTQITSSVLQAYAIGLPAYIAIKVFSTVHWAHQDTKTPVKIAIIATVINIILSLLFIQFMGAAGIALATALTGWLQFVMHLNALEDKEMAFDERFKKAWPKIVGASLIMVATIFAASYLDLPNALLLTIALVIAGLAIYGALVLALELVSIDQLRNLKRKKQ